MEIDLQTSFGGLQLRSPIIIGSCPMTLNELQRIAMISNGAGAIVLPSIVAGMNGQAKNFNSHFDYGSFEAYLDVVNQVTRETTPVIASLTGSLNDDWKDLPVRIQDAGAHAIELSLRPTDFTNMDSRAIEDQIVSLTQAVDRRIEIPLFLKLTRKFTNISHMARRLRPHVQGLILFGRTPVVDIELDSLKLSTCWGLTEPGTAVQNLETVIRTREEFPQMSLAACGGIGNSVDLIKCLLAGANVAMITSALYRNGAGIIGTLKEGLVKFMNDRNLKTIKELHSICPLLSTVSSELDCGFPETDGKTKVGQNDSDRPVECNKYGHPRATNQ
ncbi:MAG: dihydroorotate dehydrogenase [Planctomycetota bacterium]